MFKNRLADYQYFLLFFIVSLLIYVLGILRVKSIFWGDSLYYFAYTRSIVLDHDIDFSNQAYDPTLHFPNPPVVSSITGMITNKFSPGTAIFWIPGFAVGMMISIIGNLVAGPELFSLDGSGILPQFLVAVSAVFFSVLGLWYVFKMLQDWFDKKVAWLTVGLLFFVTQLFYYTAMDPVNSHSISFLISSLLLFQVSKIFKDTITWKRVIFMGILAGFLILIRNQDAVVALPVVLALLFAKKESLLNKLNWLTLYAGSALIIFSIQLYTTISLFGVLGSPYLISGDTFSWFRPDFIRVLFSQGNGLLFFAPFLIVPIVSLFYKIVLVIKHKDKTKISTPFLLLLISGSAFLSQLYIVASWMEEIVGGPYGSRMFVSVLPHFSIGIAFFIQYLIKKYNKIKLSMIYISLLLLFALNMLMQVFVMLYRF